MSTNINSTEQIVEINAGDQITNVNIISQSTTQVISGEQIVTVDVNTGTIPAEWGSISGTLSNQTDLQNALNAKQNNITLTTNGISGAATFNNSVLNIPNYSGQGLTSVGLAMPSAFSVSGSPLTSNGTISVLGAGTGAQYIKGDGSLGTFPTTIDQSLRLIREVYNKTGSTLTKGTVVYINGGQGNLPTVTKALATGDSTSAQTFGIVQSDITNMNNGFVVIAGGIDNIDTQAYTEGTALYLSPTTAGTWTSTKPYAPNHLVYIGTVVRSHPTQGVVEVRIANGYELDEIHNVSARYPNNNDGLFYNSTSNVWENKSIAGVLGYTPVPQSRIITINGTAQDLSADRTYNVGTVTSVAASGGTGISIAGSPVTGSGTITIINTAPDQVVGLTGAGTTSISGTYPNFTITSNDQYTGTVTSVAASGGTGISISGSPITGSGTISITNTAPDKIVSLTGTGTTSVSGTYPNFTINSADQYTGTVTNVAVSGGNGITISGSPVTGSGTITVTNSAPDQTVTITGGGTTVVSGTYPNFNITSNDAYVGTVTSVAASGGTGISITGSPITSNGTLNIVNTAPDQTVTITPSGLATVSGTYPNFTVGVSTAYSGSVTSVNASVPTGFEVSGVPITTSGTVDIRFASGYSLPTNAKQTQWDDAYTKRINSLTVTGNSGSSTLVSNVLNVPTYTLSGLGGEPAITAGTTSQYWRGDKTFQTLNTGVVPESGNVYFTEPRVRATVLSGLNITGGSISASDSVLDAFGKVQNQINGLMGGSIFQSTWNASTNTPTLTSSSGTKGYYYIVSVAGTTNLNGITDWQIGDWAIFDGTVWRKVDNTDAVVSVNGFTGTVSLGISNLADVSASSPTDTQLLRFNGTTSKWYNWTPTYISGNQTITLSGDVTGSGTTAITTSIGTGKVTNAMLAGSINYAKMDAATVPTWNQDTTGNAATADKWKIARTITIGATGKSVDGSANVSWSLAEIGAFSNPMTTLGDIIYGGASGAATRLAGNTVASKRFLTQTGDGTNSAAPTWAVISSSDLPALPNAITFNNGGAGATSGTTYDGSAARTISYNTIGAQAAGNYVTLDTAQTITALKTISFANAAGYALKVQNTSATGYGMKINPGGDAYEALRISNAADTADNIKLYGNGNATFAGDVTVAKIIKSGGTSSQYLMADGSVSTLTNPVTGTGAANQITYWSSSSAVTGSTTFTYSPTTALLINNSVTAATAIARGTNITSTLIAAANNDVLVGLDINPTFTNGAFTGVSNISLRVTGNSQIGTVTSGTWNGSVIGSSYGGAGTVSGILKANGSGTVSAAVAGTDYVAPSALSGYLPLSGGTLTGAETISFANTSGSIDNNAYLRLVNTGAATLNQSIDIVMRWQDGTYNGTGGISMVRESATARSGKLILQPIDSSGNNVAAMTLASTGAATFTGALSGTSATFSTEVTSSGSQGRFGGWSTGAGYQGAALEAGVSGGTAVLIGYNRTTSVYIPLTIGGNTNQTTTIGGNTIVLQNNGVTALSIASTGAATFSGNVGINGVGPTYPLYVRVGTNQRFRVVDGGSGYTQLASLNDAEGAYTPIMIGNSWLQFASTGTATFSSSVTATSAYLSNPLGLNVGGYNFYSQTVSGAMGILGHNLRANNSVANQVDVVNSGWYSSMIKMYYSEGITFHTSATSYNAGDVYPIAATERMRITSGGLVNINDTANTTYRLYVNGTGYFNGALTSSSLSTLGDATLGNGSNVSSVTIQSVSEGTLNIKSAVDVAGNVQIKLFNSNTASAYWIKEDANRNLLFLDNTTEKLQLTANGQISYNPLSPKVTSATISGTGTQTPSLNTSDTYVFIGSSASAYTLTIANPTGTPTQGQKMVIRFKDNGTQVMTLSWGTQFRASTDLALPTTTTAGKTLYCGFIYNSTDTKWDMVALLNNF